MAPPVEIHLDFQDHPALSVLLDEGQRARFKAALELACPNASGDATVCEAVSGAALSENERVLFRLGYALLRGWGAGLLPHTLWGLDGKTAERLLAGIACAMDPKGAASLLGRAAAVCVAVGTSPPDGPT